MTDVKLLPLPEPKNFLTGIYSADEVRACVEANTEALHVEIERLRAEVGELAAQAKWESDQHDRVMEEARAAEAQRDTLAEALRELLAVTPAKAPAGGIIVGIEKRHADALRSAKEILARASQPAKDQPGG